MIIKPKSLLLPFFSLIVFFYCCPLIQEKFSLRGFHYDAISVLSRAHLISKPGYQLFRDVFDMHAPLATTIYSYLLKLSDNLSFSITIDGWIGVIPLLILVVILKINLRSSLAPFIIALAPLLYLRFFSSPSIFEYSHHLENYGTLFLTLSLLFYHLSLTHHLKRFDYLYLFFALLCLLCKEQFLFPVLALEISYLIHKKKSGFSRTLIFVALISATLISEDVRLYLYHWINSYLPIMKNYISEEKFELSKLIYKSSKALYSIHVTSFSKIIFSGDVVIAFLTLTLLHSKNKKVLEALFLLAMSLFPCYIGHRYYGHYFMIPSVFFILYISAILDEMSLVKNKLALTLCIYLGAIHAIYAFIVKDSTTYLEDQKLRNAEIEISEIIQSKRHTSPLKLSHYFENTKSMIVYYCYTENVHFSQYFSDPRYQHHKRDQQFNQRFLSSFIDSDLFIIGKSCLHSSETWIDLSIIIETSQLIFENDYYQLYQRNLVSHTPKNTDPIEIPFND